MSLTHEDYDCILSFYDEMNQSQQDAVQEIVDDENRNTSEFCTDTFLYAFDQAGCSTFSVSDRDEILAGIDNLTAQQLIDADEIRQSNATIKEKSKTFWTWLWQIIND